MNQPYEGDPVIGVIRPAQTYILNTEGNQPVTEVKFQSRWAQSREVGSKIFYLLSANNRFKGLHAGAFKILMSMIHRYGVARDDCAGLLIKANLIERGEGEENTPVRHLLSRGVGLAETSNYVPITKLLEAGIIRRIDYGGPDQDEFEIPMPDQIASRDPMPWDEEARASSEALLSSECDDAPDTLQDKNLARASSEALLSSESKARASSESSLDARARNFAKSDSGTGNAVARASSEPPKMDILSYPSMDHDDDPLEGEEEGEEDSSRANVLAILQSIVFEQKKLDPGGLRALAANRNCTEERIAEAHAATLLRLSRARSKGKKCDPHATFCWMVREGVPESMKPAGPKPIDPKIETQRRAQSQANAARAELAALGDEERKRRMIDLSRREGSAMWATLWRNNLGQPPAMLSDQMVAAILRQQPIKPAPAEAGAR